MKKHDGKYDRNKEFCMITEGYTIPLQHLNK